MAEVVVKGLAALQRANAMVEREISVELKDALIDAARPVATDAEQLARSSIRRIGIPWSQMRIGVTRRAVYVAPKQRRRVRRPSAARPNLARLLIERSMVPALERNQSQIEQRVNVMLNDLFDRWARVG